MRVLYISHNGMLENLGQAQVLPYLRGLTRRGFEFDLLSFELPTASRDDIAVLEQSLRTDGIRWHPMRRTRDPRLQRKVVESLTGVARALSTSVARRPAIVHGRSYLPTAVGDLVASLLPRARLLFDCRGMLGDEYVDAGYWTPERLEYRLIKRYERRAFHRAEGIVVLTDTLKRLARASNWIGPRSHIEAIPCCVDQERFRFNPRERERRRAELGVSNRLVIVYSGSLGGWYQEPELASFAGMMRRAARGPVSFMVLTHQDAAHLVSLLERAGLERAEIIVRKVPPQEMPSYLCAGDLALSFIKSCFSKQGSSPTKVAEYLACGLPVVLNGDIGDQADLAEEKDACVVLSSLSEADLATAVERALPLTHRPMEERARVGREVADRRFGLERVGVTRYENLYRAMVDGRSSS